jgi:hypothetical protein
MSDGMKYILFLIALLGGLGWLIYENPELLNPVDEAKVRAQLKPVVKPYMDHNFGKPMK